MSLNGRSRSDEMRLTMGFIDGVNRWMFKFTSRKIVPISVLAMRLLISLLHLAYHL